MKKEINRFVKIPLVVTAVCVPIFTVLLWNLRHFQAEEMIEYTKILGVTAIVYAAVQIAALLALRHYVIRKAEGK